jgi:hypothetical protein
MESTDVMGNAGGRKEDHASAEEEGEEEEEETGEEDTGQEG